jgi:hypothetical protein
MSVKVFKIFNFQFSKNKQQFLNIFKKGEDLQFALEQ